jgi:hypothetical protein
VAAPDVRDVDGSAAGMVAPATERLQDALTSMQVAAAALVSNSLWPSLSSRRLLPPMPSPVTGGGVSGADGGRSQLPGAGQVNSSAASPTINDIASRQASSLHGAQPGRVAVSIYAYAGHPIDPEHPDLEQQQQQVSEASSRS